MSDDDKIRPFNPRKGNPHRPVRDRIGNVQRVHFSRLHEKRTEQETQGSHSGQHDGRYDTPKKANQRLVTEALAEREEQKARLEINGQVLAFIRGKIDAIESEIADALEKKRERLVIRTPGFTPGGRRPFEAMPISIFAELFYRPEFPRNPQAYVDSVNAWLKQRGRIPTVQIEGQKEEGKFSDDEIFVLDFTKKAEVGHH